MKKTIITIIAIVIVICVAFWAKGYYNDRYVVSDSYYTQIPLDEKIEDSWLVDASGVKQEKGKEYNLIGYNKDGEEKEISFKQKGTAENYYKPGTYIKVNSSKSITLGFEVVTENDVPKNALEKIKSSGTRK